MRLRREIYDHIRMLLFEEPIDRFPTTDIHLHEAEIWTIFPPFGVDRFPT